MRRGRWRRHVVSWSLHLGGTKLVFSLLDLRFGHGSRIEIVKQKGPYR